MKVGNQLPVGFDEYIKDLIDFSVRATEYLTEADAPVPEHPTSQRERSWLFCKRLKLGQKIGLLLFALRTGELTEGGQTRLLYLQEKASLEAIALGLKFCERLTNESKLQSDFKLGLVYLNSRPRSKRFRKSETRRIGVGYRDKGTLPESSTRARRKADEESFVYFDDLSEKLRSYLRQKYPALVTINGWLDPEEIRTPLASDSRLLQLLLDPV